MWITFTVQGHSNIQYLPGRYKKKVKMPTPKVLKQMLVLPCVFQKGLGWKNIYNCYISFKVVNQSCKTSLYKVSPNMTRYLFFPVNENQPTLETQQLIRRHARASRVRIILTVAGINTGKKSSNKFALVSFRSTWLDVAWATRSLVHLD